MAGDAAAGAGLLGALSVRELLELEVLRGAELIAGSAGTERLVRRLNVMSVPEIVAWTKDDEFLLATGYPLPASPAELAELVARLHDRGVAGLGVKLDRYTASIAPEAVSRAEELDFPLVLVPRAAAFDDILSQAFTAIVNRQAAVLTAAQEIHDSFLRIALAGGGLQRLAAELATMLRGAGVLIADPDGRPLAASGEAKALEQLRALVISDGAVHRVPGEPADDGARAGRGPRSPLVAPIRAGELRHGVVVALAGAEALPPIARIALDQGALVAALEITRALAVSAVERQFASNALHDLVTSPPADVADAVERAASFDWDFQRRLSVLVGRRDETTRGIGEPAGVEEAASDRAIATWTSAVRGRDGAAAVAGFATELVAVVGADGAGELAGTLQSEMSAVSNVSYSIGMSRVETVPEGIPRAYQDARTALSVGRRMKGRAAVTDSDELGLFRLIAKVSDEDLGDFVEDALGPVLALASPAREDLLLTLPRAAGQPAQRRPLLPHPPLPLQHAAIPGEQAGAAPRPLHEQPLRGAAPRRRPPCPRPRGAPGHRSPGPRRGSFPGLRRPVRHRLTGPFSAPEGTISPSGGIRGSVPWHG